MSTVPETSTARCRSCAGPLKRVDPTSAQAACEYCGAIQMFAIPGSARLPAPRSQHITVERTADGLRIRYRMVTWGKVLMAVMGALGLLPVVMLFAGVVMKALPVGAIVCPLGFTVLIVAAFVQFLQRTVVVVERGEVCAWESPSLVSRERCFKAAQISQVFSSQEAHVEDSQGGYRYRTYALSVVLKDGRSVKLLSGFSEAADILFIEEAVEKAVGLPDRPVGGEMPR